MAGALTKAGRYQIVSELGRGSMGVVYQGYDPIIGRTVAIKTMLTEGLPLQEFQEYKARFQREAQAAGVLAHPNIVTVYDFGEDNSVLYLAMEYLEGKSLEKLVEEQGILPIETIIPMYDQVCSALDHAHTHKIVHRDIKPANIMILDSGLVKVTDFGIAKMLSVGMTQAGQILGTPNYMSPEQVKGRPVDGRSDIFSLGVILYELITGEKPFGGQNITTVIYKIINENPIPPRELDATIHPGLNYIIGKALAKSPDERYQTCRELADDLKNYKNLGGQPAATQTVVLKVPPIPGAQFEPPPQQVVAQPVEKPPVRQVSWQVIPPATKQQQGTSPVVWVLLTLIIVGVLGGGGYYFFVMRNRNFGQLEVKANVEGAKITVDGRSEPGWVTPYTIPELATGTHKVVISKQGYSDFQQDVTVERGRLNPLTATLTEIQVTPPPEPPPGGQEPMTVEKKPGAEVIATKPEPTKPVEGLRGGATVPTPERLTKPGSAPKSGQLVVASNISGAKISIDGRSEPDWVAPHTFPELSASTHQVVVSKEGYSDYQQSVTIEAGRTKNLYAPLTEPRGEIRIETTPPGAEVIIDDNSYGASPVQTMLPVGKHTYRIPQPGRAPYESSFEIKYDGHMIKKKVDLGGGMPTTGVVEVRTIPPGATILADGKPMAGTTPTSFRLTTGRHTLVITLSGFRPEQKEIDVTPDGIQIPIRLSR